VSSVRALATGLSRTISGCIAVACVAGLSASLYAGRPDSTAPPGAGTIHSRPQAAPATPGSRSMAFSLPHFISPASAASVSADPSRRRPVEQDGEITEARLEADPPTVKTAPARAGTEEGEPTLHSWAPAGMLIPPPPAPKPPAAQATATPVAPAASRDEQSAVTSAAAAPAPSDRVVTTTADDAHPAAPSAQPRNLAQQPKPKRLQKAKRRQTDSGDVETAINNGFDTLQKSISSLF
jgi:hypothetical protein